MIDETVIKEYLKRGYSQMKNRKTPYFDIDYRSNDSDDDYYYLNTKVTVEKNIFPIDETKKGYEILVSLVLCVLRQLQEISSKDNIKFLVLRDLEFREQNEDEYEIYAIINLEKTNHEI